MFIASISMVVKISKRVHMVTYGNLIYHSLNKKKMNSEMKMK
jgi:hypothetical protein